MMIQKFNPKVQRGKGSKMARGLFHRPRGLRNCLVVQELADDAIDCQSGSEHPHSIGSAAHRSRSSLFKRWAALLHLILKNHQPTAKVKRRYAAGRSVNRFQSWRRTRLARGVGGAVPFLP